MTKYTVIIETDDGLNGEENFYADNYTLHSGTNADHYEFRNGNGELLKSFRASDVKEIHTDANTHS